MYKVMASFLSCLSIYRVTSGLTAAHYRLKDCDTTWLYGPLQSSSKNAKPPGTEASSAAPSRRGFNLKKKPILKRNNMPEFILQSSPIYAPPLKQAPVTIPVQETREFLKKHGEDNVAYPLSLQRGNQDTSSLAASSGLSNTTSPCPELKHIHFNELVEQYIAIDTTGDYTHEEDCDVYDYDSSSSDDGIMMKPVRSNKRVSWYKKQSRKPANLDGKIIAKQPPSYLKYRAHTPEIGMNTATRVSLWEFFLALR